MEGEKLWRLVLDQVNARLFLFGGHFRNRDLIRPVDEELGARQPGINRDLDALGMAGTLCKDRALEKYRRSLWPAARFRGCFYHPGDSGFDRHPLLLSAGSHPRVDLAPGDGPAAWRRGRELDRPDYHRLGDRFFIGRH